MLNSSRPPKPIKMRNRAYKQNADLVELNEYGGVGDEKPLLNMKPPTFGTSTPIVNENFIDKIKAKLDMLD